MWYDIDSLMFFQMGLFLFKIPYWSMVAFLPTGLAAYSLINWIIQNLMTCARLPPGSRPLPETSFWRLPTSTSTSRGRQRPGRPKSTNLMTFCGGKNFSAFSVELSLTKETWGDAGGEGAVGAVQQVRHRDGDHQDWKVRETASHIFLNLKLIQLVDLSYHFMMRVSA